MAITSQSDIGGGVIPYRVKKVIQSIKEIVGNHSDSDIYAVLKESNMDPDETAQKLLNQDPFLEVKRRRDKKKELTGHRDSSHTRRFVEHMGHSTDSRTYVEHIVHPKNTRTYVEHKVRSTNSHTYVEHMVHPKISRTYVEHKVHSTNDRIILHKNVRRGGYIRNSVTGVSREFRIVKDNRINQNSNKDVKPELVQQLALKNPVVKKVIEKREVETLDQKHSAGTMQSRCAITKEEVGHAAMNSEAQIEVADNRNVHSNSVIGSSSDPVHVPSPACKSTGAVGAVGVRKQFLTHPTSESTVSNTLSTVPSPEFTKSLNATSEPKITSMPNDKSSSGSQHNSKSHQSIIGHQKANQSLEWKPKPGQKATVISHITNAKTSSPPLRCAVNISSKLVDVNNLADTHSQFDIFDDQHVIIPQHLRVSESELSQLRFGSFGQKLRVLDSEPTQLRFGSFGVEFESTNASSAFENVEQSCDGPSISISASILVGESGDTSVYDLADPTDFQDDVTWSNSPVSDEGLEQAGSEVLNHQNVKNYVDIGLLQSLSPSQNSSRTHDMQTSISHSGFSAYDSQTSYSVPFLRTVMEDNVSSQGLSSSSEAVSSHATISSSPSSSNVNLMLQQQQPPFHHLYSQQTLHISQFPPNFVPYRHLFSPVYVPPPIAIPNYTSNPVAAAAAYPLHPTNAINANSNYLVLPKYATTASHQYNKLSALPTAVSPAAAYGNYTNPTSNMLAISPPGTVEDGTRIRFKDNNNLYPPNRLAESSDIWFQTPRELPSLQSSGTPPYYNFIPGAQASHLQYPGLFYPTSLAASPAGAPHQLVHQSGNIGAAASSVPQMGAYQQQQQQQQQPQLTHVNWPANF